jgi:quinol monooxygenase YgiN
MKFVQIIEYSTTKPDECQAVLDEFLAATAGKRGGARGTVTRDRDQPTVYLQIVEFPSYDEAMKNSESPEVQTMAGKMMALCDGPPKFRNLDVIFEE